MTVVCTFRDILKGDARMVEDAESRVRAIAAQLALSVAVRKTTGFGGIAMDFTLECEEQRCQQVQDSLRNGGFSPTLRKRAVYTASEVDAAELLVLSFGGDPGAHFQVDPPVDLARPGACRACWAGSRLITGFPITLEAKGRDTRISSIYENQQLLLDTGIVDALIAAGADPADFVTAKTETPPLASGAYFALQPSASLSPLHTSTRGIEQPNASLGPPRSEGPCRVCGRDGFFHSRDAFVPVVDRRSCASLWAKGFNRAQLAQTWEHFGVGNRPEHVRHFPACPLMVVNQATRAILSNISGGKLRWTPVALV